MTGWKRKDESGDMALLRKEENDVLAEGILFANLCPIVAKCSLKMLDIWDASFVI